MREWEAMARRFIHARGPSAGAKGASHSTEPLKLASPGPSLPGSGYRTTGSSEMDSAIADFLTLFPDAKVRRASTKDKGVSWARWSMKKLLEGSSRPLSN